MASAQTHRGSVSKATTLRRSSRITSARTPNSVQQAKTSKRPREEDEVLPSRASPEPVSKRVRTSAALVGELRENGTWPTEEQEKTMDRFRDIHHALARKRSSASLRRKRSDASFAETVPTPTASDQKPRGEKSAPYKHPRYEGHLQERGSFIDNYEEGITAESKKLCQRLLNAPQSPPEHTRFSDNKIFEKTCRRIRGENETKVVRDIALLIVPSAEILADNGAKHLEILRETTNAGWINAIPFYGPRPQPDFGLGFKREAFNRDQLRKLQPFIGNDLEDCSYIAATYNMYLPFLTSENAYSQTVALRGLIELFRLVGQEDELHREINGFSISHSDEYVRVWGHYAVINRRDFTFYRHLIAKICSVIDMLPADLNFEVSEQSELQSLDQGLASTHLGLSQRLKVHSLADGRVIRDSQPITPDTMIQARSNIAKRKKK
ncbi:hypothetical protein CC80DRAFT_521710 [Byssothecium circinans]|uniref:DUF7924 domain-containing protein n=1 Tax=Byssothecium circinans TaxID=147558 RepID=A0A6A5UCK4_9PLEO|nr:hypothetical protein CC80DRAFT_521710 [Byssothecium circinans]